MRRLESDQIGTDLLKTINFYLSIKQNSSYLIEPNLVSANQV